MAVGQLSMGSGDTSIAEATKTKAGLMSAADKTKEDRFADPASATEGQVLTSDGKGGTAWGQAPSGGKREPFLAVDTSTLKIGGTITATYRGAGTLSAESSDTSLATVSVSGKTVTVTRLSTTAEATITINLSATDDYYSDSVTVVVPRGKRYGYKIKKTESDPSARVEYMYDAVGRTPAHMDFTAGKFDYGDWGSEWFVTDNKPLMLKADGTVDYYLNPLDYTQREDGTDSDVANTSYNGNAMAQFPLVWVKRWEDDNYLYEAISDIQWDSDYKAYAHTRADGSIAAYFYWSLFGGSGSATKIRSISGQALAAKLTAEQEITGAKANGAKWYTHTWSQRCLIQTLCVLLGKSTDTQTVFGTGNCRSGSEGSVLAAGTLKDKGQFFGYSGNTQQVKVFHVEKFWGDQWDRTAGLINSGGKIHVKMTPEGNGYRITDVNGYTNTGITLASGGWISGAKCSEYGIIPNAASGGETTYFCDYSWANNNQLDYLFAGVSAYHATAQGGSFSFDVDYAPSRAGWDIGCGLSCEMPAA